MNKINITFDVDDRYRHALHSGSIDMVANKNKSNSDDVSGSYTSKKQTEPIVAAGIINPIDGIDSIRWKEESKRIKERQRTVDNEECNRRLRKLAVLLDDTTSIANQLVRDYHNSNSNDDGSIFTYNISSSTPESDSYLYMKAVDEIDRMRKRILSRINCGYNTNPTSTSTTTPNTASEVVADFYANILDDSLNNSNDCEHRYTRDNLSDLIEKEICKTKSKFPDLHIGCASPVVKAPRGRKVSTYRDRHLPVHNLFASNNVINDWKCMVNSRSVCISSINDSSNSIDVSNKLPIIRNSTSSRGYGKHDSNELMKIQQAILELESHTPIDSSRPSTFTSITAGGSHDDDATLKVQNMLALKSALHLGTLTGAYIADNLLLSRRKC